MMPPFPLIITTLTAHAYSGEADVFDALKRILSTMPQFIYKNGDDYVIPNPSNTEENFADKWNKEPAKATAFFKWLEKAKKDIIEVAPYVTDDYTYLEEVFGESAVGRAFSEMYPIQHNSQLSEADYNDANIRKAFAVIHRQKPPFNLPRGYVLGIKATYTHNGQSYEYKNNGQSIPKDCSLDFSLMVSPNLLKKSYTVIWQIVNTGVEAKMANCLRGGFTPKVNSTKHNESTKYSGQHFIQAFLLKRGHCVAMSKEFIVNIQ